MRIRTLFWGFLTAWFISRPVYASLAVSATVATTGNGGLSAAIIDPGDTFAVFGGTVPVVVGSALDSFLSTLQISPTFLLSATDAYVDNVNDFSAAALDPTTGSGYWVTNSSPSVLMKVTVQSNPPTFSSSDSSMTFQTGQANIHAAVLDSKNGFGYFATETSTSVIVKVRLSDLTIISSMTLPVPQLSFISAAVIDTAGGFAYFASSMTPGAVAKIQLSNFSLAGTLSFSSGEGGVGSAVIDTTKQIGYFGTHDSPGKVVSVSLSNLTLNSAVTLKAGENDLTSAVIDTGLNTAYFGTNTSSGIVVPISLSNLFEQTSVTLGAGQNFLTSAVIDLTNSFAYFGTFTTPGQVIQMDLLAGPPTIQLSPNSVSAHPGDSVTFTVVATGRNLTYQWQDNGVTIPGATASSYTRVVANTDDQSSFACVVTNTNGSVTSGAAVLTIIPVIRAFPNPWRSDRHAGINMTFDGLLANSTVKIFNLAGHWVKTLPLASNSATWDLTNDQGEKVASGYYFYTVTTGNGKQTVTGKIAIIH